MNETRPMHRRWVGSLLSLLLAGSGIYLAGDRRRGLRWFLGMTALSYAIVIIPSLHGIPSLWALVVLSVCGLAAVGWMLVRSYRPVPQLGLRGWVLFLVIAIGIDFLDWSLARQLTRPFSMPTGSMKPTIMPGDYVFAWTCAYWFKPPGRGDIVVFKTDEVDSPQVPKGLYYIKRVAGLPGERIEIKQGRLIVNGKCVDQPASLAGDDLATENPSLLTSETNSLTLPSDGYFVVGDNHTNSFDSRHFGAVPRRCIVGKVTKVYWPPSRAGELP